MKEKQQNDSMNVQQIDTEHAELQQKQREYNSRLQELDHSKRDLQGQKREIQQNTQRVNRAELKLKQLQDDLIIEKRGPEEDDAVIERLKEKIEETVASQKGLMNEYTQAIVKYVETYTELNEIKLELIQANAKFDSLRRNFKDQQLALEEAKSFVESGNIINAFHNE